MRELVGYTDYLLIATARNERQAKAIYDDVHLRLKKELSLLPTRTEGEREARWLLVDYLDCVLHVTLQAGDHDIFIGEVRALGVMEEPTPLLFYGGGYRFLNEV